MSSKPSAERHNLLVAKYFIPSMGDYSAVGGRLSAILDLLDVNRALSPEDKQFIRDKGLFALLEFVNKLEETGLQDFGILSAKSEKQQRSSSRREIFQKYDIGWVEPAHMRRMMDILLEVERGKRISENDVPWLITNEYFSPGLKRAFHRHEAMFCRESFLANKDPWHAVNASSHYRKAEMAAEALKLLEEIDIDCQKNKHLKAALYTTGGGAQRDLNLLQEALESAERAHHFDPASFHPCTLMGALYYELGDHASGDAWFTKAVERGAKAEALDHELRSIFRRLSKQERAELQRHLLDIDPDRYSWAR